MYTEVRDGLRAVHAHERARFVRELRDLADGVDRARGVGHLVHADDPDLSVGEEPGHSVQEEVRVVVARDHADLRAGEGQRNELFDVHPRSEGKRYRSEPQDAFRNCRRGQGRICRSLREGKGRSLT